MMDTSKFNFYDFVGYLIPGAVALALVSWLYVGLSGQVLPFNIADLGTSVVFLVGRYIVGHLIQPFGNWIEKRRLQEWGGWFSVQYLRDDDPHFTPEFRAKVKESIQQTFGIAVDLPKESPEVQEARRREVFGLCYAFVEKNGAAAHTDIFNGFYALYRQLLVASWLGIWVTLILLAKNVLLFVLFLVPALSKQVRSNPAFKFDLGQLGMALILLAVFIFLLGPLRSRLKRFSENFADSVYRYFYVCAKTSPT